jgi:hypothetical protein
MRSYHFDVGNSSTGPIGFCASINAKSRKEALKKLRFLLPEEVMADEGLGLKRPEEYIRVYFNDKALSTGDIDFSEPVEGDK